MKDELSRWHLQKQQHDEQIETLIQEHNLLLNQQKLMYETQINLLSKQQNEVNENKEITSAELLNLQQQLLNSNENLNTLTNRFNTLENTNVNMKRELDDKNNELFRINEIMLEKEGKLLIYI
jgi:hypothetical protein